MKNSNHIAWTAFASRLPCALATMALSLSVPAAFGVGTDTWVGNTDANWNTAANWSAGAGGSTPPANGDSLVFGAAGSSGTTLNNNISSLTLNKITFNSGASSFTITNKGFTIGTGGIDASALSSGTETFPSTNNFVGNGFQRWVVGAGATLALGYLGAGADAADLYTPNGAIVILSSTGTIKTTTADGWGWRSGAVAGTGLLGPGMVIDNGNNTYDWASVGNQTAGTSRTIAAPTYTTAANSDAHNVKVTANTTVSPNASWASLLVSGATLTHNGLNIFLDTGIILQNGGAINGSGPLKANADGLYIYVPDTGTITSTIQNNGSTVKLLYKAGPGTLTLNAAINKNSYTGGTVVYQGALTLANGGQQGEIRGALTIYSNATVNLNAADALGWDTVASGTTVPTVNIVGGMLNNALSGNQGFNTTFNLQGGIMTNSAANTGVQGYNFNGSSSGLNSLATNIVSTIYTPVILRADGLTINTAQGSAPGGVDLTIVSPIIVNGGNSWTKAGAGTLQLAATNTFNGGTLTISAGTLLIGGAGQLNSGNYSGAIANSGTLNYGSSANQTLSGAISGTGSLVMSGSGILTLSTSNSYSGNTTISSGILALGASGAVASTAKISVSGGATFDVSAKNGYTLGSSTTNLSGSGVVTGAMTTAASTIITPATEGTVGTLSFSNNLTMTSGSKFSLDVSNSSHTSGNDNVVVNGTLTLNGNTLNVRPASASALDNSGDYVLVTANSISGNPASTINWIGNTPSNAGNYTAVVSGNTIVLRYTAVNPPSVGTTTYNPASPVYVGTSVTASASVVNTGTGLTYQWQSSSDNITWANASGTSTSATYAPSTSTAGTAYYRLIATDSNGSGTNAGVALVVNSADVGAAYFQTNGVTDTANAVYLGTAVTAGAIITGASGTTTYQWQTNLDGGATWYNIPGATSSNYSLSTASPGTIYYRLQASDGGNTKSGTGTALTVNPTLFTWNGGTGNWTSVNWQPNNLTSPLYAGPTSGSVVTAVVTNGQVTVDVNGGVGGVGSIVLASGGKMFVHNATYGGYSDIVLLGGTLDTADNGSYHAYGSSVLSAVTAGGSVASTIATSGGGWFNLGGQNATSPATFTVSNGATLNVTGVLKDAIAANDNNYLSVGLIKSGGGTLTLSGVNPYAGNTVISNGVLALSGGGSIANSANIILSGTTFDVSGLSSTFSLGSGKVLMATNNGTGTIAGNLNLGSGSLALNYTNGTPSLLVTNGIFKFNSNAVTVTVSGTALPVGSYRLISTNAGGSVSGTLPAMLTINGAGTAGGATNFLKVVNNELFLVVDHAPAVATMNVTRTAGLSLKIAWSDLATNWSDADADTISLSSFNLTTTNSATLQTNSTWILYTNNLNVNDRFNYTVVDAQGATTAGVVNIIVNPFVTGQNTTVAVSGGAASVSFYGIPGYSYITQRATNIVTPNWKDISTNTVANDGRIDVTDSFTDLGGTPDSAYYRLKWQP